MSLCCDWRGSPPQAAQRPTSQLQPEPAQAAPADTAQPASAGSPHSHPGSQPANQSGNHANLTKMWIEKTRTKLIRNIIPRAITRQRNTLFAVSRCHTYTPSDWAIMPCSFGTDDSSRQTLLLSFSHASLWGGRFPPAWVAGFVVSRVASGVSQATSTLFPQLHILCQRGYHLAGHPCQPLVVFLESHLVASIFTRSIILTRKHNLIRL